MGKVPIRLKEVVYTLSPFEQNVMSGLWKDMPHKTSHYMTKVRFHMIVEIGLIFLFPYENDHMLNLMNCRQENLDSGLFSLCILLCGIAVTTKRRRSKANAFN